VISELNTAPMHALTNASPRHHWSSTHSSGPERIATPYSAEDLPSTSITRRLTSYSMPVLTGAFPTSLSLVSQGTQRHRVFPFKIFFSVPFVISERYIPYFTPMIPLFSVSSVISVRDNLCAFCLPRLLKRSVNATARCPVASGNRTEAHLTGVAKQQIS